jgi:predicted alpha/beta hydrolase family esterase
MVAHGLGAMLVPRVGPGLFVVVAGAGLVAVAAVAATRNGGEAKGVPA